MIQKKTTKYIGIHLTKKVNNMYTEKYKILMKIEDTNRKMLQVYGLEELILLIVHIQSNLQIECNFQ
jgi:hypothetical protein